MKIGIVLSTSNNETNWNALRLANFSIAQGDEVSIFLIGEGVEYENYSNDKFNIKEQLKDFLKTGKGKIFACGTCIKSRNREGTETCPVNSIKDLHRIIKECDKLISF